jgi:hypothetical protein
MPTKQEIEAELQASEGEKAAAKLREMLTDFQEWEASLRAEERKVWQPHWSHDDPFPDRLRRVGFPETTIAEVKRQMEFMRVAIRTGEISPEIQKQLDEENAAERSALAQLSTIVSAGKK